MLSKMMLSLFTCYQSDLTKVSLILFEDYLFNHVTENVKDGKWFIFSK
jgi:hypothetical protein